MAEEALDAGPLSLADYLALEGRLAPLPYGIATHGPARSVILFSRVPVEALGGATVGITDETSTSVEVLRILLALRYRVVPGAWVGAGDPADAALLIGDQAIRALTGTRPFPHALDLGQAWFEWTGLPCVFARWGVRAAVPEAERRALAAAIEAALHRGLAGLGDIARRRRDTSWGEAEVIAYLRGFAYRVGPPEERAIAEFVRLRSRLAGTPGPGPDAAAAPRA
jgi:chorismate dehydratase